MIMTFILNNCLRLIMASVIIGSIGLAGCTKKPKEEDFSKLEEARAAAESAERKLSELRKERIALESELKEREGELQLQEREKDELKRKKGGE
jgi:outer membrane murein-binding lipoprotein Lpp